MTSGTPQRTEPGDEKGTGPGHENAAADQPARQPTATPPPNPIPTPAPIPHPSAAAPGRPVSGGEETPPEPLAGLAAEVLPGRVATADTFDDYDESLLFPEELAAISRAWEKRRREFTTVRVCARRALAELGQPPVPMLSGTRNAPRWPGGIVGSMTHCDGYRAAAVAHATDLRALGIDAEPNGPLPEGVLETIALPSEARWAEADAADGTAVHRGRLLFSAKESVYKTWYPLIGTELEFLDAEIDFTETSQPTAAPSASTASSGGSPQAAGEFTARLLRVPLPEHPRPGQHPVPTSFTGRWLLRDGFLLTAVALRPLP